MAVLSQLINNIILRNKKKTSVWVNCIWGVSTKRNGTDKESLEVMGEKGAQSVQNAYNKENGNLQWRNKIEYAKLNI